MTFTTVKTIGSTGVFSTPQLWEDGAPANLTTAEKSAAGTFLVAAFIQGEALTFVGSGAAGTLIDTDSTGAGTGSYVSYGLTSGNPAASDVVTGGTSGATCVLSSGTPTATGCIWQGQLQNQEFSGTGTQLTISGSTSLSTAYKELTTVAGASFRDHANAQTNPLRYDATVGAAIRGTSANTVTVNLNEASSRISKIQSTGTGAGGRALNLGQASSIADSLILEGLYTANTATIGVLSVVNNSIIVKNCVAIQRASAADHIVGTGIASPSFYNCTFVASDDHATAPVSIFLSGASGTVTVQNCALFAGADKPTDAGSATFTYTTCYGDDSTPATGITTATYADQFQNVNDATRDFRLKAGAGCIDTGTTDSTNAATDIVGTARPQGTFYDVGCWELILTSQGPNSGTGSSINWTNPTNVAVSDNSYSTVAISLGTTSAAPLKDLTFGFSIPTGATINGIVVEIEKKVDSTARNPKDNSVKLTKDGSALIGNEKASASVWPTSDTYSTYGASNDLWGLTWTANEINASTFGVILSGKRDAGKSGTTTYSVDHIRITVYYTAGASITSMQQQSMIPITILCM